MKILKIFFFVIIIITAFFACEKDEICLEETTPRLIIRFYNIDEPDELKKVSKLAARVEGIEDFYSDGAISLATDSIVIPIRAEQDFTKIELVLNGSDLDPENDNSDFINLTYNREDKFVSRSCGYKALFYDVKTSFEVDDDNWVKSIKTVETPQNITNEYEAHVKIYH